MKNVNELIKKKVQLMPMNQMVGPNKISYQNVQERREGQLHEIQENLRVQKPNNIQNMVDKMTYKGKYKRY